MAVGLVLGLALALVGCTPRIHEEYKLWNLFGIEAALDANVPVATSDDLPDGIPANKFLTRTSSGVTLNVQRAFAEGAPAAFVTTEIWVDFYDAVWTQPLYAQFIDATTPLGGAPRVIDVGPDSTFYSPFWRVSIAVVGDGDTHRYQSTKKLLDEASQIIPAGLRTCPLHPTSIGGALALPAPWDAWNIALQTVPQGDAVRDDEGTVQMFGLFDFGPNLYELEVEEHGSVVEASPMFVFAKPDGTLNIDEPRVLGAGEVGDDPSGPRPRYGGLWNLVKVILPGGAGPFHGDEHPSARDAVNAAGGDALDYEGRFALDAGCFNGGAFPTGCTWLDSQDHLEEALGDGHLQPTEITQTGPIVLWQKQAVPVNQ